MFFMMIFGFQVQTKESCENFVPPGLNLTNRKMSALTDMCEGESTALRTNIVDLFNATNSGSALLTNITNLHHGGKYTKIIV